MDILHRAADIIDRAQERVSGAAQQAARVAYTAAHIRDLEARQLELRAQLEAAVTELGKLTFQRWKNHGVGNDAALASLCQNIDGLNAAYQEVLGAMADARASVTPSQYGTGRGRGSWQQPHSGNPMIGGYDASAPPVQHNGNGHVHVEPYVDYTPTAAESMAPDAAHAQVRAGARQASECPECFTLVPGASHFCPSCGMRV